MRLQLRTLLTVNGFLFVLLAALFLLSAHF